MADQKNLLLLERSAQNLQKITRNGKTMLEGVFAEFGIENRNGRIYEEKEYLPHMEYLKKDIANGNLLGELDHPERFEVALGSVSHRVSELWYDQNKRQVLGRIEILEGTPKGQVAKALLDAGVPLSISSRAAGTVNEDKTVQIQQIYTYDLVAKPGFESAQLHKVNESANPRQAEINRLIQQLNESSNSRKEHSINSEFGVVNENISIIDLTDKYPQVKLREEAKALIKNNETQKMAETKPEIMNEEALQKWTIAFNKELGAINERLNNLKTDEALASEVANLKKYVEKIRKIQEDSLNWSSEIAKAVNEVATYADTLARKSNEHYKLTKKIGSTVDYNAKALNVTQDWTGEIAKVTNAIGETVDHNAEMLNGLNEWTTQIAKGVNALNEWGEEKAKAINGMHEWTSSIAKNLNHTVNWTEDMFGAAISKEDAVKLMEYVDYVAEAKANPELKKQIDEMLSTHSITGKPLNEANLKGISVITADNLPKLPKSSTNTAHTKNNSVTFDGKTIVAKMKAAKLGKEKMPVGNDKLQMNPNKAGGKLPKDGGCCNDPKDLQTGLKLTKTLGSGKEKPAANGPKNYTKAQNLKLNVKGGGKGLTNESLSKVEDIQTRKSNLDEKLSKIIDNLENQKKQDEGVKTQFPFTQLLSESDRSRFANLSANDKAKVANQVSKVPTTDTTTVLKLWETALAKDKVEEPLWLQLAPKAYREAFDKSSDLVKENIKAKSEFFTLNTAYQIENFWEQSGIITKPVLTLNESIAAVTPEESEIKMDSFVASIGEAMKRYNY